MGTNPKQPVGTLPQDTSHLPIQITSGFTTVDASSTPKKSPLSYTTGITKIKVPTEALSIDIAPSTDMRISEDPTMSSYTIVPKDCEVEFGVAEMVYIYVAGDLAGGTLNFRFNTII